jgi:histidine ammonia-lyase
MVSLDGNRLTLSEVKAVAVAGEPVQMDQQARDRMNRSRGSVLNLAIADSPIYAVNTGVGLLANTRLSPSELEQLQLNVIRSHACGCGSPLPQEVVRAMMLIRANVLAKGLSGVRVEVAETLCQLLNHHVTPVVPSRGSVGASGDLAPLAHIALVLIGEGKAEVGGHIVQGDEALRHAGIAPLTLALKEGVSLVNGTQAMLAIGTLQLLELQNLVASADIVSGLTVRALLGKTAAFDERIHSVRPHPGQRFTATVLSSLLAGSATFASDSNGKRIQDAYSLRCIPQVHGAVRDAMSYANQVFTIELNSATDNPLVFDDEILSGGNFHGAPLALALDFLAIALCQLAGISERRTERLVNPALNEGLPAFLASNPGLESGLMMAQVTAASLIAEIRVLANPASTCSIPTSGNQEDFVSMGMTSALKLMEITKLARLVLAIEALAAVRGLQFRDLQRTGDILDHAQEIIFQECAVSLKDEDLTESIAKADECIARGTLASLQAEVVAGRESAPIHQGVNHRDL